MFGIGTFELVVIVIVFLIAVGPRKLPTVLRATGKAVREFRRAMNEFRRSAGIDDLLDDADYRPVQRPAPPRVNEPVVHSLAEPSPTEEPKDTPPPVEVKNE